MVWYNLKVIPEKIYFDSNAHSLLRRIENTLRNISTQHKYQKTILKDQKEMESQPPALKNYTLCADLKIHAKTYAIRYDGIKVYKIKNT